MGKNAGWGIILSVCLMLGLLWFGSNDTATKLTNPPEDTKTHVTCSDFYKQGDAQDFFNSHVGENEVYKNLDKDKDGIVCEGLKKGR